MSAQNNIVLPTYVKNVEEETYHEELNQTLQFFLNAEGWQPPLLTNAQAAAVAPVLQIGAFWFNTDLAKMQLKTAQPNIIQTITSV